MRSFNFYITAIFAVFVTQFSYCQVVPNNSSQPSAQQVYYLPPALSAAAKINYVRTWEPWKAISNPDSVSFQTTAGVKQTTAFIDGLGTLIQTVTKQMSPNQKDMVVYKTFDDYGREVLQYLPYISDSTNGYLKTNPFLEQKTYYSTGSLNNNQYTGEQVYYGRTAFESSPLGRADTVMAAGNSWAGNNRGVISKNLFNTSADSVRLWTIADSINSVAVTNSMYSQGQLYKTIVSDEHGKQVIEYKDKEGKLILKKVQLATSPATGHYGWICTYYIYDIYSQLRCVIQPLGVELLSAGSWSLTSSLLNEQCFKYDYDQRNRVIIKKVPGAGEVWLVYDVLNRLVATQDAMLRIQSKWQYTLYDKMDRPYSTGLLTTSDNRTQVQQVVTHLKVTPFTMQYTNEELTHTWFDDYTYDGAKAWDDGDLSRLNAGENPYPETVANTALTYGLATGSKVKVLGTASQYLVVTTFYDNKGRTQQTLSDNEKGGVDITTTQYDFAGKVLSNCLKISNPSGLPSTTTILTKNLYDQAGRLVKVWKQINDDETDHLILENSYDELGLLKSKKLAPAFNENEGLETLNYKYTIRGWLESINKDYAENVNNDSWFGQTFSYDYGFSSQQYNGNISGIRWRSKGDGEWRAYGYTYDAVNRLKVADFRQYTNSSWSIEAGIDFTVNNLAYDANGNILKMRQKGWKLGGASLIDDLEYAYISNSNKLLKIIDKENDYTSKLGDFKYDPSTKDADDYHYYANGNLAWDDNKKISTITYNHLNLPVEINVTGKGTITYLYDALGNKLKKTTVDDSTSTTTVTDYIGEFIYQNDSLQFFGHEEGRIRYIPPVGETPANFAFDYFIKDHLGNVRLMLTEEQRTDAYPAATMETDNSSIEETIYSNLPESRTNRPEYHDDYTDPNEKAAVVKGKADHAPVVGPAMILKVMSGDKFNIRVSSWHDNNVRPGDPINPLSEILAHLTTAVGNLPGSHFTPEELTSNNVFSGGLEEFLDDQDEDYDDGRPKAFVSWILFDEKFNYVGSSSGFEQVGEGEDLTIHAFNDLPVNKSGYLYIYVSNSDPDVEVFFDNLQVTHIRGPLLEENHYYPFGLTMAGLSSKALNFGDAENKLLFNGYERQNNEFSDGTGLDWYDYKHRFYDNQIGRFFTQDGLADKYVYYSPYQFAGNEVPNAIDLDGLEPWNPMGRFGRNVISQWNQYWRGEGVVYNALDWFNRNLNPVGMVSHGAYKTVTGKDLLTGEEGSRLEGLAQLGFGLFSFAGAPILNRVNAWCRSTVASANIRESSFAASESWTPGTGTLSNTVNSGKYVSPSVDELTNIAVRQYENTAPLDKIGGAYIYGSKGLNGQNFIYDLALVEGKGSNMVEILTGISKQATEAGASTVTINGYAVINPDLVKLFQTVQKQGGTFLGWQVTGGTAKNTNVILTKVLNK